MADSASNHVKKRQIITPLSPDEYIHKLSKSSPKNLALLSKTKYGKFDDMKENKESPKMNIPINNKISNYLCSTRSINNDGIFI